MKGGKTTAICVIAVALVGLSGEVRSHHVIGSAIASQGFDPGVSYPHRDHTYDGYLQAAPGLSQYQLNRLFHHVAMPQSHGAMVSILGYPTAEDGDFVYWSINGGSSELAVEYIGSTAWRYTVGGF
ncbi:MAG: hypothetical protein AAGC93_16680 [Cyanobacteria bacterium P01_F01_bin.53]